MLKEEGKMGKSVQPITPSEARKSKLQDIPEQVIEAFNEMIAKKFRNGDARFTLSEVHDLAASKLSKAGISKAAGAIEENHWMDVEKVYEKAGWKVKYDQPGYNESYNAFFVFSAKR